MELAEALIEHFDATRAPLAQAIVARLDARKPRSVLRSAFVAW